MALPAREGRVTRVAADLESDSVKIGRLEEAVGGIREDVGDIKSDLRTFKESFEHRLSYVEDVRLRGLEDREIARKAVADERARATDAARAAAEQAAAHVADERKLRISRRDLWGTAILLAIAAVVAALITAGVI